MRANPPQQKPGQSKQDFSTPYEFIDAVVREFGSIAFDLAADVRNCKASNFFSKEQDGLAQDWLELPSGNWWLNPEFGSIAPWTQKCAEHMLSGDMHTARSRILMLTTAGISTNWFRDHVYPYAWVLALNPRMSFDGTGNDFPKDLMLSVYGAPPGFDVWCWKEDPLPNGARSWLWRAT